MKFLRKLKNKIDDACWWFIHRIHPRHRYHVINTGLNPGYWDPSEQILYASFNVACDYYENGATAFDWEATPTHHEIYKKLDQIYKYWRGGERDKLYEKSMNFLHNGKSEDWWECEKYISSQDKKHLHMLVDILPSLWYA